MTVEEMHAMEERMVADLPWLSHVGALTLAAVVAVVLALLLPRGRQGLAGAWVAGAHLAAAGLAAAVWLDRGPQLVMEGTVAVDGLSLAITAILGVAGALTVAVVRPVVAGTDREGELYAVLAAATLASVVLVSARDAALLAISLGLTSLASFVMTGYLRRSARGNEASIKYYIYGTAAGATMVYGLSWWFGLAGTTDLAGIGAALPAAPQAAVIASLVLVLVGLGYKAAIVPFHFWAPDAYEGAPLPVAAYLSIVPKVAGLVALARVFPLALPDALLGWDTSLAALAAATMLVGTIAAVPQDNVVRLLAYSSVAQSGFLLMAVAALPGAGDALRALVFYAAAYAVGNLAAFAAVLAVQRERRSVRLGAFAGLGRTHPWWTAALVLGFLSLLGLPPLAGFVGKLELFRAAIDAGQAWLAAVGVAATVVSLYPYLRVLAPALLDEPPRAALSSPRPAGPSLTAALALSAAGTVLVGVAAGPLLAVAGDAGAL